jgi:hypothetical protein
MPPAQLPWWRWVSNQRTAPPASALSAIDEMDAVVGEHGVDLVRNSGDAVPVGFCSDPGRSLLMKLDEGELEGSVARDQQVELALLGTNLGDADVGVADRVAVELASDGCIALEVDGCAMPSRWSPRCRDERVSCGMLVWGA